MRPVTTLFMLMSVDGKISTGDIDKFDFDKDLPNVPFVSKGLSQYYDLEKETDFWSFNTGRVMAKMGWNSRVVNPNLSDISFVIYDNEWLHHDGVCNLASSLNKLIIISSRGIHPATYCNHPNVHIIDISNGSICDAFEQLYEKYNCDRITIQSGGRMNSMLLRAGLIDNINLVVVPLLVGGRLVSTIMDGDSIQKIDELIPMKLAGVEILKDSYLNLHYKVLNK